MSIWNRNFIISFYFYWWLHQPTSFNNQHFIHSSSAFFIIIFFSLISQIQSRFMYVFFHLQHNESSQEVSKITFLFIYFLCKSSNHKTPKINERNTFAVKAPLLISLLPFSVNVNFFFQWKHWKMSSHTRVHLENIIICMSYDLWA